MTRNWCRRLLGSAAIAATLLAGTGAAWADTLFGAMEKAYTTNPTLNKARAGLRATDEQVPQALSGWRPTVTLGADLGRNWNESLVKNQFGPGASHRKSDQYTGDMSITLSQPLFRGFRTTEATKAADARVDAGRQSLLQTEQEVLFNVVSAYMDVYAGRQLVSLQKQNVAALQGQLKAANERFNVGEITKTDVAQARSSLAAAKSSLVNAQASLAQDVATYLQLVGNEPGKLSYPKIVNLPKSLQAALATAGEINPRILAQAFVEIATQHDIGVERSALLPSASLNASAQMSDNLDDQYYGNSQASVSASLRVPLYEAGLAYSQVRQAKQLASQQRIAVIEVARAVRQAVAASWNAFVALGDIIKNAKTQVAAAQLALDGVQQEYKAGTRTTLDVLNAQSELISARVTLVNAEKNRVVAAYQLMAATGKLTAHDLGLGVAIYDPEQNYRRVRDKWFGTGVETVE